MVLGGKCRGKTRDTKTEMGKRNRERWMRKEVKYGRKSSGLKRETTFPQTDAGCILTIKQDDT